MSSHYANEKYFLINQDVSKKLFAEKYKTRIYQNAHLAVYDVVFSLQQYLSHKPQIGLVKNGTSLIELMGSIWLRTSTPLQIKTLEQDWFEYIDRLSAETNFVIWASENEITGEVIVDEKLAQEIHQRLSQKRIFSIQICHHFNPMLELLPYVIKILRPSIFVNSQSLVVHTDKFKATSLVGSFQDIDLDEKIFDFITQADQKINDRIVLNLDQVNAYAIQQSLLLENKLCFAPSKYPFWILDVWKNWWKQAEDETFLRGLMIVSIHAVRRDPDLLQKIQATADQFRRLGV